MPGTSSATFLKGALVTLACVMLVAPANVRADGQSGEAGSSAASEAPAKPHPREKTLMKRQWGIEVLFVRQTSAGYMLEFRYKVLDPEKAKPLFDRQIKPMLIHEETGAAFVVPTPPKTGALRNSNPPLADHTYWMFFANPGQYVKKGDHVTVEIGDFVAKNIVVE
jgi:hypothetical protein